MPPRSFPRITAASDLVAPDPVKKLLERLTLACFRRISYRYAEELKRKQYRYAPFFYSMLDGVNE
eukprot:8898974-Pyramimonas_sp.AAC.1